MHIEDGFISAIEAIYDAAATPSKWPFALDIISNYFGAAGTVLLFQRTDHTITSIVSSSLIEAQKEYEQGAWRLDFLAPRVMEQTMKPNSRCYTENDVATPNEINNHPFFTQFRAKYGLGSILASAIMPHPKVSVGLSVQGVRGKKPFSDNDIKSLERFLPHIEKALTLSIRIIDAELGQLALMKALSQLSCGIFLLSNSLKVIHQNEAAKKLLGGELQLNENTLHVIGKQKDVFIRSCQKCSLLTDTSNTEYNSNPIIIRSPNKKSIILYIMPVYPRSFSDVLFASVQLLILAIEHSKSEPINPPLIRDLLGLTLAEARLASLIGSGQSPRTAADNLNISESTARTVLKRIFSKTGVSRQSELAALLSNILYKS